MAVAAFNRQILQDLKNSGRQVKNLHVFSDGCGGQFKNCSTLSFVTTPTLLHPDLDNMDWSFFATSHGKGPIDGIGGTVKRAVWTRVLRHKTVINTAEEFSKVAQQACPNVNVIFVPKDVAKVEEQLENFWSKNQPKTIPNTRSFHHFKRETTKTVSAAVISPFSGHNIEYSTFDMYKTTSCGPSSSTSMSQSEEQPSTSASNTAYDEPETIKLEHYYAVDYVDRFYIGRVLSQEQNDVWKIKFLHKTTVGGVSYFSWPDRDDSEEVHHQNIFYGPIVLSGSLPFTIPDIAKINTAFALRG